ncbi:hypothetical protein GY45DRAFT_1430191 [Cubamyces sp. BRFM 1775]|nr:hypothetical protein GY45DRAFT_1430191 [Cubamyces sp. BRFM 1775]
MSDHQAAIVAAWHLLEISGSIQAVLCALFGIYFSLFILVLWTNHGRRDVSSRVLRIVSIVLFVDLCAHFVSRSLQFSRARVMKPNADEFFTWSVPLLVIGNVTTTFAGLCSDGLLAWRFYVLFERRNWALYIPGTFVVINALLCWSADAMHLAAYTHYEFYEGVLLDVTLKITVAWGWLMFAINTVLTWAIITKIFSVSQPHGQLRTYKTVLRACIESALVTWIGLLLYEICSLAPEGHVVTNYDVGFVMASVLPVFFGISQCLIVVRVTLANEFARSRPQIQSSEERRSHRRLQTLSSGTPSVAMVNGHGKIGSTDTVSKSGASMGTGEEEHMLRVLSPIGRRVDV